MPYNKSLLNTIPLFDPYIQSEGFYFDEKAAQRPITFFEKYLTLSESGKPYVLMDYHQAILLNLYGWLDKETLLRRFNELFLYIARKNAKTELCAGLGLYGLYADMEHNAKIVCAAANEEQACSLFDAAKGMVLRNKYLKSVSKIYKKSIVVEKTNSEFKVVSSKANTKHGLNIHYGLVDELHALDNRELPDVLFSSMGARKQPIRVCLTSAPYEGISICNEKYEYAKQVRDAKTPSDIGWNPKFLPVIYETLPTEDWKDRNVWKKANPAWNKALKPSFLENEFTQAQAIKSYENTFKRLYLSMRTPTAYKWLDMDLWKDNNKVIDESILKNEVAWAGLDMSTVCDLTAFVLYFPNIKTFKCWTWVPVDNALEKERRDRVPYRQWQNQGLCELTEGDWQHKELIKEQVLKIVSEHRVEGVAYDRAEASGVVQALDAVGVKCYEFGQGYLSMSYPTKDFEINWRSKQFNFLNNDCLKWNLSNVHIETDSQLNYKASKGKSPHKIDLAVAAIMALGVSLDNKIKNEPQIFKL